MIDSDTDSSLHSSFVSDFSTDVEDQSLSTVSENSSQDSSQDSQNSNSSLSSSDQQNSSASSQNSNDTEPYDFDEEDLAGNPPEMHRANMPEESLIIVDTQSQALGAAAAGFDDDDEDVVLIPENVETIDLCTQPFIPVNMHHLQNEVIEILDSPTPATRRVRNITPPVAGPIRSGLRNRNNASTPYQRDNNQRPRASPPRTTGTNTPNSSLDYSQSQSVKISCPICFESVITRNPQSTTCGHIFCKACLQAAIQAVKKCPMCRKTLGKNGYHNIHLA